MSYLRNDDIASTFPGMTPQREDKGGRDVKRSREVYSLVVLALVVRVTLVVALPGQVVLLVTANVEGDEETGVSLIHRGWES